MKPIIIAVAFTNYVSVASAAELKFRMQEIDATLKVGYGVVIADVNGDGKSDIVVADANRVVWYENPTSSPPAAKPATCGFIGTRGGSRLRNWRAGSVSDRRRASEAMLTRGYWRALSPVAHAPSSPKMLVAALAESDPPSFRHSDFLESRHVSG